MLMKTLRGNACTHDTAIYGDFVPEYLVDTFGSSGPYMTMPLNNWLYGWRDPEALLLEMSQIQH